MVEKLTGSPSLLWVLFQTVTKKIFALILQIFWNAGYLTHTQLEHDLEFTVQFMPWALQWISEYTLTLHDLHNPSHQGCSSFFIIKLELHKVKVNVKSNKVILSVVFK